MAFEPPLVTRQFRAVEVENAAKLPCLLKALDDPDTKWDLVEEKPQTTMATAPGTGHLPPITTVRFANGTTRHFNPSDQVLVGPVTNRRGGDKQEIREVAVGHDWEWDWLHDEGDDRDVFNRGDWRVEVFYEENNAAYEALRIHPITVTMPFTGTGAKVAALNWLKAKVDAPESS